MLLIVAILTPVFSYKEHLYVSVSNVFLRVTITPSVSLDLMSTIFKPVSLSVCYLDNLACSWTCSKLIQSIYFLKYFLISGVDFSSTNLNSLKLPALGFLVIPSSRLIAT